MLSGYLQLAIGPKSKDYLDSIVVLIPLWTRIRICIGFSMNKFIYFPENGSYSRLIVSCFAKRWEIKIF